MHRNFTQLIFWNLLIALTITNSRNEANFSQISNLISSYTWQSTWIYNESSDCCAVISGYNRGNCGNHFYIISCLSFQMIIYILNKRKLYRCSICVNLNWSTKSTYTRCEWNKYFGYHYIFEFFLMQLATTCMTDAECGSGECCFRHEGPLIMSRRQLTASLFTSNHGNVWNTTPFLLLQ